ASTMEAAMRQRLMARWAAAGLRTERPLLRRAAGRPARGPVPPPARSGPGLPMTTHPKVCKGGRHVVRNVSASAIVLIDKYIFRKYECQLLFITRFGPLRDPWTARGQPIVYLAAARGQ